jgi:predicted NUDIX family NTP pyrophosphohydrolase
MPEHSAGILLYRLRGKGGEVLLVHPGGPLWANRDQGTWSIPKGLYDPASEDPLAAARREFAEETGREAPPIDPVDLGVARQASGKLVHAFALPGDLDVATLVSNTFEMEWPPHSGALAHFAEVDRAEWFDVHTAREKILPGQSAFLDRLEDGLASDGGTVSLPRRV